MVPTTPGQTSWLSAQYKTSLPYLPSKFRVLLAILLLGALTSDGSAAGDGKPSGRHSGCLTVHGLESLQKQGAIVWH